MSPIEAFRDTKPYYDALFIIRHTKIEGEPATLLQNHGTVFHLQAILNRLDYSYADSRSYNALIEEMKKQIQGRQTLSEFHSKICQIFNLAMTKCEIDYPGNTHSLQQVTKEMAIDCFRNGINGEFTQHTLYAAKPRDLESAYAIATEILYKRQNNPIRREAYNYPKHPQNERRYQPGVQPIPHMERPNPTPMDVDSIGRFRPRIISINNSNRINRIPSETTMNDKEQDTHLSIPIEENHLNETTNQRHPDII